MLLNIYIQNIDGSADSDDNVASDNSDNSDSKIKMSLKMKCH